MFLARLYIIKHIRIFRLHLPTEFKHFDFSSNCVIILSIISAYLLEPMCKFTYYIMTEKEAASLQIKLIAVGDSGVGKSSILVRFTNNKFDEFSEPTLGAAFISKKFTLPDGRQI